LSGSPVKEGEKVLIATGKNNSRRKKIMHKWEH
jgi:hypothetical protein